MIGIGARDSIYAYITLASERVKAYSGLAGRDSEEEIGAGIADNPAGMQSAPQLAVSVARSHLCLLT